MQGIESLTTALVSTALDAASVRQQVIASNIANAGRADYVTQRVSFEATLAAAAQRTDGIDRREVDSPFDLRTRIEPDRMADGSSRPIQLDQEVGALAQNSMHYQALVRGLSKYLSLMAIAVGDGKR
jgi:flagellar basal-body rod protein FlgB